MQIKGMDGQSYNVTGQGQGTYNTIGASAGILAFLQNGGLGNIFGCNGRNGWGYNGDGGCCSDNTPVNRYELTMTTALAAKDGEIALLKADKYTDQKIVEVTSYLEGQINSLAAEVRANKDAQYATNLQQATLNATQTATISCMSQQIAQLQSLSQLVVPSRNVCDTSCGCGCVNA